MTAANKEIIRKINRGFEADDVIATLARAGDALSSGAATALTVTYAIPVLMAAYVAETLAKLTGAPTSWHIMGVLLAITALAWLCARGKKGALQPQ